MLVEFVTNASSTLSSTPEFASLTRSASGPVVETTGGVGSEELELTGAVGGSGPATWTGDSAVGWDESAESALLGVMVLVAAGESASVAEAAREHPPANGRSPKAKARLQLQRNWFFIDGPDRSGFMLPLSRSFDCTDFSNIHGLKQS